MAVLPLGDRIALAHVVRGVAMCRVLEAIGGVRYKTYRIYERDV